MVTKRNTLSLVFNGLKWFRPDTQYNWKYQRLCREHLVEAAQGFYTKPREVAV